MSIEPQHKPRDTFWRDVVFYSLALVVAAAVGMALAFKDLHW